MAPTTNYQVKQIIEYLSGRIANLKEKLKQYESPIMQDMAKNSPHLQYDYIRLSVELQTLEDNLLAIEKFTDIPKEQDAEVGKNNKTRKK